MKKKNVLKQMAKAKRKYYIKRLVTVKEKKCISCKETKDANDFYKHGQASDGLQSYCKQCVSDKGKERHDKRQIVVLEKLIANMPTMPEYVFEDLLKAKIFSSPLPPQADRYQSLLSYS